ncbi:MAG: hypothetical protein ACI88L_000129 [Candidatus Paceibacteria bacterium]|jgi:hypothetical protein
MKIKSILSKQTTLILILTISFATLFLPLTSLQAATISNGMEASNVIGQSDFTSNTALMDQSHIIVPTAIAYDTVNDILFAAGLIFDDEDNDAFRIVTYDLSSGITDGVNATNVIGQANFTAAVTGTTAGTFSTLISDVEYDSVNERLFVSDYFNSRVLVFDLSGGITNGMSATYVLGQANLTTLDVPGSNLATSTVGFPDSLAYDSLNDMLFVGDTFYERVVAFDLSGGITNNMDASYVIDDTDFNTPVAGLTQSAFQNPKGLEYDSQNKYLYVASDLQNRTLVYDFSGGVSNGMSASYVLGQADFTSNTATVSASGLSGPSDIAYDHSSLTLFISDSSNNRVLGYDISGGITNGMEASNVLGQSDFLSNSTGLTSRTLNEQGKMVFDPTSGSLLVADTSNYRALIFDLSATVSSSSENGRGYIHPPLCEATITPNTITAGEETTLSWNTNWPTENQNTYYSKVPGEGLFSSKVNSISIQPEHTTTYRLATFNLWGANFCEATVEVLDENGEEVTSNNNSRLTAGVSNSPIVRAVTSWFAGLFVR